jgi:hypothetical protein
LKKKKNTTHCVMTTPKNFSTMWTEVSFCPEIAVGAGNDPV